MFVKEIMTTHVVALHYTMSFLDAAKTFLAYHVSGAPVINEQRELLGILSEKDLMRAMYPSYENIHEFPYAFFDEELEDAVDLVKAKTVSDIMSQRVVTTTPDTHILKVGGQMIATGIHRIPVITEEKKLVGMVSRGDVYRALLEEKFHIYNLRQSSHSLHPA